MALLLCSYQAVHPHARGDIRIIQTWCEDYGGTPPRTWGHWEDEAQELRNQRYTPTHVGTFSLPYKKFSIDTVHPHARGDI